MRCAKQRRLAKSQRRLSSPNGALRTARKQAPPMTPWHNHKRTTTQTTLGKKANELQLKALSSRSGRKPSLQTQQSPASRFTQSECSTQPWPSEQKS
ncbi:hypothetical protein EYF80_013802 [Liparis tanakae]|uniref:Uncharacterized protein n=1 Tax=Liparis tanakae TaxID=230148 RepID=A0A4Z2ID76_9TELE|nr:hypothetical protein EYF80_013802 [Liparis tanakae]